MNRKEYITNLTNRDKTFKTKQETTKLKPQTLTAGRKLIFRETKKVLLFEADLHKGMDYST